MIKCTFEDGNQVLLRHVCVDTLVIKDGKILLNKRGTFGGRKILEYGKWGVIGGFVERDETLEQAVKREIKEETAWVIKDLFLLRINDDPNRPKEDRQNFSFVFVANADYRDGESHDEEVLSLEWFDLNDLPESEELAFDHEENIELYKKWLKEKFSLPVLGKI
jgi:ADP-ribose pyrophosphatase YjhB (NUDIX family)